MLGLLLVLVGQSGCTYARLAMKSFWQRVPPVRWPVRTSEPNTADAEKVAEPTVAANVAIKKEAPADPDSERSMVEGEVVPRSQFSRVSSRLPRTDSWSTGEVSSWPEPIDSLDSKSHGFQNSDRRQSPLDRLDAALSDDVQQAQALPQQSLTVIEQRYRVELLVTRAKALLALGQFDQALEIAELAQQLSESVQLDFLPDEDRPVDVIRRIEGQMEAARSLPKSEELNSETEALKGKAGEKITTGESNSPEQQLKELTRKNRNWTDLFRRVKKPANPEGDALLPSSEAVKLGLPLDLNATESFPENEPQPGQPGAVVMANRSVSLRMLEPSKMLEPSGEQSSPAPSSEFDEPVPPIAGALEPEFEATVAVPASTLLADGESRFTVREQRTLSTGELDEESTAMPEFESVEIPVRSQKVTAHRDEPLQMQADDEPNSVHEIDWLLAYGIIGVCTIVALVCYRSGTT